MPLLYIKLMLAIPAGNPQQMLDTSSQSKGGKP
jgi:hypothetical protein